MTPKDIDWREYEEYAYGVLTACLGWLQQNPPDDPIYVFGVEGDIEGGGIFVSAKTVDSRNGANDWYPPDWQIRNIEDSLDDEMPNPLLDIFMEFYEDDEYADWWDETCRAYRHACLSAMQRIHVELAGYSFPQSEEMSLFYMDEPGGLCRGIDEIDATLNQLKMPNS